jgi:hypothetical protein
MLCALRRHKKIVFNFGRANWEQLNDDLTRRLPLEFSENMEKAWESWTKTFWDCVKNNVPTKKLRSNQQQRLPWFSKSLKKLIARRDKLFTKWFKNKTTAARELFINARKEAQRAIRRAKDNWMWNLGKGPDGSKFFWKYINSRSKLPINNTTFNAEGKTVTEPQEVANLFNQNFKKNFSTVAGIFPFMRRRAVPNLPQTQPPSLSEITINAGEVHNLLQAVKQNSAMGPDKIPAIVLKKCAGALSTSLAELFSMSLKSGVLAHDWKSATVTPIHKDGDKKDINNYRPISVTSLVGKVLEKHVRNKTAEFLTQEKIIPDSQHGFTKGRSCITMLLKTIEDWTVALDTNSGTHIHAVFLDWSKAFDKVPHSRLLSKLKHYGIEGNLLRWFENFLTGRTQRVQFGGARSDLSDVPSGVIQGSVLGPLLFNIFIADLPNCIKTNIKQYADDCTLYKEVKKNDPEAANALQEDLDSVDAWCANNGMTLNALKCKVMDITHARSPHTPKYTIGGTELKYVETERLLGVHLSKNLKWNYHTDIVRAKSAQVLGFAKRNLKGCTPRVKRMAYLTMVKPILFYGTPAIHPESKGNIQKFERMQKRALRFIYGKHLPPVAEQKLMPVQMQLRYNDLLFFKKCETGDTDCNARERVIQGRVLRGDSSTHPRLLPPPGRNEFGRKAYSYRVIKPWNDLPDPLKDCSANQFPALCKAHLWQTFNV